MQLWRLAGFVVGWIRHPVRHVPGSNMFTSEITVSLLVIKKHISLISTQEFCFVEAAEKNRLVDANVPGSECADDTLVGGR